jgi:hypothetical protein
MSRTRKFVAAVALGAAAVTMSAVPAFAKPSSNSESGSKAYIGDGTCDLLEENQVLVGSTLLYAIVKLPDGVLYTDLTYELNDKGKLVVTLTPLLVEDCEGPYVVISLAGASGQPAGSYTLEVTYTADGKNFSSDSFRFVEAEV